MKSKPVIGITMGDPAGIGAEIIVKALHKSSIRDLASYVVVGSMKAMGDAMRICGMDMDIQVVHLGCPDDFQYGKVDARCGDYAFRYIVKGIELAQAGIVDAVVTAPIHKESLHVSGHNYDGHTEIFAEYTKTSDFAMMLACGSFRVIHVSTHCSLIEACSRVTKERVYKTIQLADLGVKQLGVEAPRIAVAGLNPHSGENGLFGDEEIREIMPAIADTKAQGLDVSGPYPPDTVFTKALGGLYDVVVAMYHDQGHIPLKQAGFVIDADSGAYGDMRGINTTIGLPIIRVSVDHGVAFGKAGKGTASSASMEDAIQAAAAMVAYKRGEQA